MSPLDFPCPDCSVLRREPCLADASRKTTYCIGRDRLMPVPTASFTIANGFVREYDGGKPAVKREPRERILMRPIRCSACGEEGHNARNPDCPKKAP